LIGEAGGWISPSSAEGLSYAFRSALRLAEAVESRLDGFEKRYHRLTGRLRRNLWLKNRKSPVIFNPMLRAAVMRSGAGSMELHLGEDQWGQVGDSCG
jgi:flavin-dependent dehydrogenase